jgi:cobyrinic acid a,c-diamide synthase
MGKEESMKPVAPGLVIAAPRSSSGKTTVTLGLLRAFSRRGTAIRGLKCGPDYIDPAFHQAASGQPSLNLDAWAMAPDLVATLARDAAEKADLTLCEGLMGLFDGVPAPLGRSGSSADIAAATGWPVLLVLDVSGQSQSAGAIVKGCASFDPRVTLAGVILNKVGSERHRRLVSDAIASTGIPVLGSLPRDKEASLPERHLGLVQAEETAGLEAILTHMADLVETHTDLDAIRAAARQPRLRALTSAHSLQPPGQRIALARDAAFSFIYPHHLALWRQAGAEIVPFSPLADEAPPDDCDVCWLPGGYPELHASTLSNATCFLTGLRRFAESRPVHGECGGYMALGASLTDASGTEWPMAGLLGVKTSFASRKMMLGYRDVTLLSDGPLGSEGTRLRGHEFHYATILDLGGDLPLVTARDAYGTPPMPAGSRRGSVSGTFFHVIAKQDDTPTTSGAGDGH